MSDARLPALGQRVALYPGSFDPIHNGHVDVARRAASLFDRVIVSVYDRPDKRVHFSTAARVDLATQAVAHIPNVEVASYTILTVDYAVARGAQAIVRGLRATSDFEFEFQLALMNRHLNQQIEALFLMTSLEHAHLSSSLVKEITELGASPDGLVPPAVADALRRRHEELRQ